MFFIFFGFNVSSQSLLPEIRKTRIGVYAGPNLSQLLSDNYKDTRARIGYQYGAYIQHGKRFFLRNELAMYSMSSKLFTIDTSLVTPNNFGVIDLKFVHIPAQFGVRVFKAPAKILVIWLSAGGYLEQIYKISDNNLNLDFGDFNTFSYGLIGSVGVDLSIFSFQLSYKQGKRPIFKKDNNSLKYTLAFSFGIKI